MAVKPYTAEERDIEVKRRIDEVQETKATRLDLSGLGLEAIPEAVYEFGWLTELDLGPHESIKEKPYYSYTQNDKKLCNTVRDVPEAFANALPHLTHLNLGFNEIGDEGARALTALTNLTYLDLGSNEIGDEGAKALTALTNLTNLDLGSNEIGAEGARALTALTNLTYLYLGSNEIGAEGAKALTALTNLTYLDLSYCELKEPCEELWLLPKLESVVLYESKIEGIPQEVLSKEDRENCLPALRAHLDSLKAGVETVSDVKLIVLGNGLIGKTQICRRLKDEEFDESVKSTHGIHVSSVELTCRQKENKIPFHIWDFGGQDIYLGTHSLFLSSRAIFQLVWVPSSEENKYHEYEGQKFRNFPLSYWVNYAREFGHKKSPIVMVQTQCDTPDCVEHNLPLQKTALSDLSFSKVLQYSAKTDEGRNALEEALFSAAKHINKVQGEIQLGAGWARVKRRLERMLTEDKERGALERKHRTLSQDEFNAICAEEGEEERAEFLLAYLKDIGTVYYQKDLFDNQIILDQEWALEAIYTIFNRDKAYKNLQRQGGKFTRSDLADWIWNTVGYSQDEQKLFLAMMLSCGMCFVHRTAVKAKDIEAEYVAPDLLPESIPEKEMIWDETLKTFAKTNHYKLLSPSLMRNILSHIGSEAGLQAYYWRDGLLIYDANTDSRALIEQTISDNWEGQISIKTQKGRAEELLFTLTRIFIEQQSKVGLKTIKVTGQGELTEQELHRDYRDELPPINYQMEPSEKSQWYVSYAWKDDKTPEGLKREEIVDQLCATAETDKGIEILRDKNVMKTGDRISRFMLNIAHGERVFVILSDKYLRSPFCMYELYEIYRLCSLEEDALLKKIRTYILGDAEIWKPKDRLQYALYWQQEFDELDKMVKEHGPDLLGYKDFQNYKYMKFFASHIGDILTTVADVLQPQNFDQLIKYGFQAED